MSKDKLVPKLRFKEFKNHLEWVKYTFGEIANYRKGPFGSALKKSIFVPKSQESVKIYEQQNAIDKNWKLERYFITKEYANKMKSFEVNPGDIIVSSAGTIGETYILPEDAEPGIINQALMRIGVNESKISKTLYIHLFENMIEDFSNKYSHGSAMKNIPPFSDLKSAETYFPSTEEQEKLVEFIKLFKIMINIQKRKLNKVKDIKSAYLSEMFPKEGEKYPKKRFEGFTKAWEFKNLETLTTTFTDGDWIESKDQSESGVRLIQTGNIGVTQFLDKPNNRKWISESTFKKLNCEEIFPGDILISRLPEPAGRATIVPKLNTRMITAVDCTIVRPSSEYSSDFLIQYLCTSNYFNKITAELAGGTRQRISRSNLAEIKVPVPKTLEEQEKIGQFFKNLDNQISTEEEKLVKLEKLKQAYLNDMFV